MSAPPSLEARDVWFEYAAGRPALRGVSLAIGQGEFVALIGQNGSGKSTLARHFNGLLRPGRGQIEVNGQDIGDQTVGALARQVGYLFQNPDHQIFSATTREEIAFGPRNLGLAEEEVQRRTEAALASFGLRDVADRQPATLSFGLRRKVTVAAVYAMQTPVLILDEPTTGLEWRGAAALMETLTTLHQKGRTIVLITHDMRLVAGYAPRCVVMAAGQIAADGRTRALLGDSELLYERQIEPPQVTRLGQTLGWAEPALAVAEFCRRYAPGG